MTETPMPEPLQFWEVPPDNGDAPVIVDTPTPKPGKAAAIRQAAERRRKIRERARQALARRPLAAEDAIY